MTFDREKFRSFDTLDVRREFLGKRESIINIKIDNHFHGLDFGNGPVCGLKKLFCIFHRIRSSGIVLLGQLEAIVPDHWKILVFIFMFNKV